MYLHVNKRLSILYSPITFAPWASDLMAVYLGLAGVFIGLLAAAFSMLAFKHYLLAQAQRLEGMEKDPIGYFGDFRFHFDEENYSEQGLVHRKKYYSYTYYTSISIFVLIAVIITGMFF